MKVFLSWSGERSRIIAEALRDILSDMLQGIDIFMSKKDLESGGRWSQSIAAELEQSEFGILCLTPENLHKPWLLFEAGALSKSMGAHACGLLLGGLEANEIDGPLSQFQHRTFSQEDVRLLLRDINGIQVNSLDSGQIDRIFPKHWPDLSIAYEDAMKLPIDHALPQVTLDEILRSVESLEKRIIGGITVEPSGFATPDEPDRYEMLMRVLSTGLAKRTLNTRVDKTAAEIEADAHYFGLPGAVFRDLAKHHGLLIAESQSPTDSPGS